MCYENEGNDYVQNEKKKKNGKLKVFEKVT